MAKPTYTPGVGGLATSRYDFQNHVDGLAFRHSADQIDVVPPLVVSGNPYSTVENALIALASNGGSGTVTSVSAGAGISISGSPSVNPTVINTGVLTTIAGMGISVSGGQNPTISNTGVLALTAGTNVTIGGTAQNPIINATGGGGSGTVTSVTAGTGINITGTTTVNPVVNNTGVLTLTAGTNVTLSGTAQNPIINASGGGGGGGGTVTSVSAGTGLTLTGSPTVNPTLSLTSPVSVANGGTGNTSLIAHSVLLGNGTGAVNTVISSTPGYPLISNGTSVDPSFGPILLGGSGVLGTLFTGNGGTGQASSGASGNVLMSDGSSWTSAPLFGPSICFVTSAPQFMSDNVLTSIIGPGPVTPPSSTGFWNIQASFSFNNIHGTFGSQQVDVTYGISLNGTSLVVSGTMTIQGTISSIGQNGAASIGYRVANTSSSVQGFYAMASAHDPVSSYSGTPVAGIGTLSIFWSAT